MQVLPKLKYRDNVKLSCIDCTVLKSMYNRRYGDLAEDVDTKFVLGNANPKKAIH